MNQNSVVYTILIKWHYWICPLRLPGKMLISVLAFLPLFYSKQANLYNIQAESLTLDPYCYFKEFEKFIKALGEENFVISFDWTTWQNKAQRFIQHR